MDNLSYNQYCLYIVGIHRWIMQPFLKVSCPNNAGFVGYAKLAVFKANGDFAGEARVDCPTSPPENTTIKDISAVTGAEAKTWRIEMSLTNNTTGHNAHQVFEGRYLHNQPNTTTGKASVTVDGVSFGGGTGWR